MTLRKPFKLCRPRIDYSELRCVLMHNVNRAICRLHVVEHVIRASCRKAARADQALFTRSLII